MKKLILCLTLITTIQCAFCEITFDNLPELKYRNPDGTEFVPNSASYPKISEIERLTFNKTFEDEPIEIRLSRLESKLYKKDYSQNSLAQRVETIENTLDEKCISNKEKNTLASLEKKIFNQTYSNQSAKERVERLEKSVLGANQCGDLNSRIATLKTASSSLEDQSRQLANMQQYNFQNDPYRPQNGLKNMVKNFFSPFSGGSMTGFSPPVTSSPYYQPYSAYQNPAQNMYNRAWNNINTNQPYANPQGANNTFYRDIFQDNGGDEMYYTDGQHYKDLRSTSGGCGVTIIN